VEYQPISDLAQLGALEDLLRVLLHFILLAGIVALCLLLALCLGDLLPLRGERRSSPGRRRGASEAPGPKPDEAGLDLAALNWTLAPLEEAAGVDTAGECGLHSAFGELPECGPPVRMSGSRRDQCGLLTQRHADRGSTLRQSRDQ
jgi:hypothetical protein